MNFFFIAFKPLRLKTLTVGQSMYYCGCGNLDLMNKTRVSTVSACSDCIKFTVPERKEGKAFHSICLCGASENIPFCDGAHKKLKMMTDPKEVERVDALYNDK